MIDPGSKQFLTTLLHDLQQDGIDTQEIDVITNTHLHCDHCGANETLKHIAGAKILSHPLQKKFHNITVIELAQFFGLPPMEPATDNYFDNNEIDTGDTKQKLIPSPGHSPDSICFYSNEDKTLICGDLVFVGTTGRVDLPGGNADELRHSIDELSRLEIKYLLPGHMDILTNINEVKSNFNSIHRNVLRWL
jgi:hydroxyacylglutathione hydrolase